MQNIEDLKPLSEEDSQDTAEDIEEELDSSKIECTDTLTLFLNKIAKHKLLTKDEEIKCANLAHQGDISARNKLINCNLRLVVNIAKKYCNRGLDFIDLIQEGVVGLMTAVKNFEPDRGFRFTTYAYHWIFEAINKAILDKGRTIRIPSNLLLAINKMYFEMYKNSDLSNAQIAEKLNINANKVKKYIKISQDVISYDTENEDGQSLIDFIEDEDQSIEDNVGNQQMGEIIDKHLQKLNAQQRQVIINRFGLYGESAKTLEEIAMLMDLSRERIRQVEKSALEKLRVWFNRNGESKVV